MRAKKMIHFVTIAGLGLALAFFAGCGGKDDDNENKDDGGDNGGVPSFTGARTGGTYSLNMQFTAAKKGTSASALNLALPDGFQFYNKTIASGHPDTYTIYIKQMNLNPVQGVAQPIFISPDESGTPLQVRSGSVDISELFTDIDCIDATGNIITVPEGGTCECGVNADGTLVEQVADEATGELYCPEVPEGATPPTATMTVDQVGPFKSIGLQLASVSNIKGCVSGTFSPRYTITGEKTYCTKTAFPQAQAATPNAWDPTAFESGTAEAVDVVFGNGGDVNLSFNFESPITLSATEPPKLTMLLDLNRVLRFTNGAYQPDASNSDDAACRGPNPSMPCGPYFFPLRPDNFMYVFVGEPGSIEGYAWIVRGKEAPEDATEVPTDYTCPDENACGDVAGWMTLVYRPEATVPFFSVFNPDDDNAKTIIKGSNQKFEPDPDTGAIDPKIDTSAIAASAETTGAIDITYSLGEQLTGAIKNFTPQTAVSSEFIGGAHFELKREGNPWEYGEVFFKRQL